MLSSRYFVIINRNTFGDSVIIFDTVAWLNAPDNGCNQSIIRLFVAKTSYIIQFAALLACFVIILRINFGRNVIIFATMTYKFNLSDLAKLCGCSRATIQRRMRAQKVKLNCLPSMVRFLYPILARQSDGGNDPRPVWRGILADRAARREDKTTEQRLAILKNLKLPSNDSLDQTVEYDFNQE